MRDKKKSKKRRSKITAIAIFHFSNELAKIAWNIIKFIAQFRLHISANRFSILICANWSAQTANTINRNIETNRTNIRCACVFPFGVSLLNNWINNWNVFIAFAFNAKTPKKNLWIKFDISHFCFMQMPSNDNNLK